MVTHAVCVVIFATLALAVNSVSKRNVDAKPISIAPSQTWDGNDGRWSAFAIQLGTPAQLVRVLFASDLNTVWAILAQGCNFATEPSVCLISRGSAFQPNISTSFQRIGDNDTTYYNLVWQGAGALNLSGNAEVGNDTVSLGDPAAGAIRVQNQVIEAFAVRFPWLGVLGLRPASIILANVSYPSMMTTLWNQGLIPSQSWAYTAGAAYKDPPIYGSLVVGGYDANRRGPEAIDVTFSEDLTLAIQSITTNYTTLLATGINILIDTLVTTIWLPIEACELFERAFNLTWNETYSLYLVDETTHTSLLAMNPEITFTISSTLSNSTTIDIRLPYASFDLNVSTPIVPTESRYFPLQRAQDPSQYILGRVFMQEVYLVTNYEYGVFSLSQAQFPAQGVGENLTTIPSKFVSSAVHHTTSIGAIVGGAIGGVAIAVVLCLLIWFCRKKKRDKASKAKKAHELSAYAHQDEKAEARRLQALRDENMPAELPSPPLSPQAELRSVDPFSANAHNWRPTLPELDGRQIPHELPA